MKKLHKLSAIFMEHAAVRVRVPDEPDEFESLLIRSYQAGRDPWPQLMLTPEEFVQHWAQRLPEKFAGLTLAEVIEKLVFRDIYLACSCLKGESEAIDELEDGYIAKLPMLIGKPNLPKDERDELQQRVRVEALVGTGKSGPALAMYKGTGTLESWLKSIAIHQSSERNTPAHTVSEEDIQAMLEAMPAPDDPHFDSIRRRYFPEICRAMVGAFVKLPPEQRQLLRLYFQSRVSTPRIATLMKCNQSTVWRNIAKALESVHEEMKSQLQERLKLSTRDFESLVNALRSQIDMSISQILGGEKAEKGKKSGKDDQKE